MFQKSFEGASWGGFQSVLEVFRGCLHVVLFLTLCFKEVTRFSKEVIRVFQGFFRV